MVRHHLGALALLAAFAMPLAASAQTFPSAPGAAAPSARVPGAAQQRHRRGDPMMHAMRRLNLSDAQKQQIAGMMKTNRLALRKQIEGVLTPDQRTQLRHPAGAIAASSDETQRARIRRRRFAVRFFRQLTE